MDNIDDLSVLFDHYRVFYKQSSNLEESKQFISNRVKTEESIAFICYIEGKPAGFVNLYPFFSSVKANKRMYLNDLYTYEEYRKRGVGRALMRAAEQYSKENGFASLKLETAIENNEGARKLYESEGWQVDTVYCSYTKRF